VATAAALLREAKALLAAAPHAPSTREAHLLLGHVLGLTEAQVIARDREPVPVEAERRFRDLLTRRLGGEPVAYLTGEREFYGRPFRVDRRVLVPRPETEHLVEAALEAAGDPGLPEAARVLDVGTGSGAIAVTLALERPRWRVVATDLSPAALALARTNARRLGVSAGSGRCRFVVCDLAAALSLDAFDLLVSNPPYVPVEEADTLSPEVRGFEPGGALFSPGGETETGPVPGTGIASLLLAQAGSLPERAVVILEIGHGQLDAVGSLAARHGWRLARAIPDYAGIPRVVVLRRRKT
jgi:release factor glutamine methyltransferase